MSQPTYRSWVTISRGQIARNYRSVCTAVGPNVDVLGVVKADAYGHGAVEVSRILEGEGARWLAVSSVEEGIILRNAGIRTRVLVMAGFLPNERDSLPRHHLTPVVHSLDEVRLLKDIPFHLKIDTGLTRLGASCGAEAIVTAVSGAKLEGLMTHFASAADYNSLQTDHQVERFLDLLEALERQGIRPPILHASSTNALAYGRKDAWFNMVRPGHALYGYVSPARGDAPKMILDVKPALTWKARILLTKDIPEGALVGYGGTFRAPRPMRLGVLALGYADGLPHRLSNKGKVIAGGRFAPFVGTVSMDLTTIDLSHSPDLSAGDEVTILGEGLDAQQIARLAGTISYNVLCGIGARVHRVYVD